MPPARDPKTGHLLTGHSGNPSGRPGRKAFREELRRLIGRYGEEAARGILDIAEGRTTLTKLVREPYPDEDKHAAALIASVVVVPSIRERLDAYTFLYEQLNGKATQEVETSHDFQVNVHHYEKLSDKELEQLEATLVKASSLPAGDVVDGEVVGNE